MHLILIENIDFDKWRTPLDQDKVNEVCVFSWCLREITGFSSLFSFCFSGLQYSLLLLWLFWSKVAVAGSRIRRWMLLHKMCISVCLCVCVWSTSSFLSLPTFHPVALLMSSSTWLRLPCGWSRQCFQQTAPEERGDEMDGANGQTNTPAPTSQHVQLRQVSPQLWRR